MSETIYLLTICLPLATIILVFGMRYWSAVQQAKARLANDQAYRDLAARAATAQSENAIALNAVNASLADLKTRIAALEKVLKEVE
jgi:Tfp pilus assembly protein PilO